MTDEEIKQKFKETYPDLMRGDTPLSPYYDIFCWGIELAENQRNTSSREYLINNYCPTKCDILFQNECKSGERVRCWVFEETLKLLEGFVSDENAVLQHRLDVAQGFLDRDMEYNRLLDVINNQDVKIADLEKKVKEYEQQLSAMEKGVCDVCKVKDADYYEKQISDLEKQLKQATQIIKDILLDSEKWDYKDLMFKPLREQAEQFIKEE